MYLYKFLCRRAKATEANIILTNFDFVHKSMLVTKNQYVRVVCQVAFLILDEAHMYRGVFGAHSAMCLRRLLMMNQVWVDVCMDVDMDVCVGRFCRCVMHLFIDVRVY